MKCILVLCLFGLVALSMAKPQDRGCSYVNGHCQEYCPEGTQAYDTFCKQLLPEATCENPTPKLQPGDVCDYSACHCVSPTVRDTKLDKCVPLDQCT